MWLLTLHLLFLISFHGNAQKNDEEPVTVRDLMMKKCQFDTTAGAMILFDRGTARIFAGGTTKVTHKFRIKFFTKEHIEKFANHSFLLDRGDQSLTRLRASTYNLVNGEIIETPLSNESVFKSKYDKYHKEVSFTLGNVREGSVIDIDYAYVLNDATIPSWQFQNVIPAQESRYEVYVPSEVQYSTELQGLLPISVQNKDERKFMQYWVIYKVPAFKAEPYIASDEDFTSTLHFHPKRSYGYWNFIMTDLNTREDFGGIIYGAKGISGLVQKLVMEKNSELEKFRVLSDYVRKNVTWNKELDKLTEQTPSETLEKKTGSSADINLLFIALLKEAKLRVAPVLISTRGHGLPKHNHPSLSQFNYVIAQVELDKRVYLVDATDKYLSPLTLPKRCVNASGLLVTQDSSKWIPITTTKARTILNAKLKLDPEGSITGSVTINLDGHDARTAREAYTLESKTEFIDEIEQDIKGEITQFEVENLENTIEPFKEKYEITIANHGIVSDDLLYLNPFIMNQTDENPFKANHRSFPIDFPNTFDNYYVAQIELPENYRVDELPKTTTISLPENGGKFLYNVSVAGRILSITCQIATHKRVFSPDYYKVLKEFYSIIVAKQAEQIVLKKVN
jgi:hypothetical protein